MIVAEFTCERRVLFVKEFVKHNTDFSEFKKIQLEPNHWSWSGSEIPVYQERIKFFELLLPLFNTISFLQHRQYIEQEIKYLRENIEREKRREFMEHD